MCFFKYSEEQSDVFWTVLKSTVLVSWCDWSSLEPLLFVKVSLFKLADFMFFRIPKAKFPHAI